MALLTVQSIVNSGLNPSLAAAAGGGDTFANDGKTYFEADNASGGSITITFDSVQACDQGFDHDLAVAVPAGEQRKIGPFPRNRFGSIVSVTYSGVTSLTVGAFSQSG